MQTKAFIDAAADAVARTIAGVKKEAERQEEMRALEHRAFMAEQREHIAGLVRKIEERLATVKDGADGKDGRDGIDGKDGADGTNGADGRDGIDGKDAYAGTARGLYDPEGSYLAMDVVSFNGSEWRAKVNDPGPLPGDGWMLSAGKGKRGDKGDRGERGMEGKSGKDGAQPIALKFDAEEMKFVMVLDDGNLLEADFYPVAQKMVEGIANG